MQALLSNRITFPLTYFWVAYYLVAYNIYWFYYFT